jgi:hypothetical protein
METQIVAQWLLADDAGLEALRSLQQSEGRVEEACGRVCFVDGNDFGGGTANIFIYAEDDDVTATVKLLVTLHNTGRLPEGMRVGIARYKNAERTDWIFEPAFPVGLKHFDITYPNGPPDGL